MFKNPFKSIDMDQAARSQYGSGSYSKLKYNHIWQWCAVVNNEEYGLDLKRAASDQHDGNHYPVTVGIRGYDWRALDFSQLAIDHTYLPVILIARDNMWNYSDVDQAITNFKSILACAKWWIWDRTGLSVDISHPIVMYGQYDSDKWNEFSDAANSEDTRYQYFEKCREVYKSGGGQEISNARTIVTVWTGFDKTEGAAAWCPGQYAALPPRATYYHLKPFVGISTPLCDSMYALLHEAFGHTAGLKHSNDAYPSDPGSDLSVMQANRNMSTALFLAPEIQDMKESPYFK